jgi:hypothetical protein
VEEVFIYLFICNLFNDALLVSKAVSPHAMEVLGGKESIAPAQS